MVHVHSLGRLMGVPGSSAPALAALHGLTGRLRDEDHGGWHHAVGPDDAPDREAGKRCYDHAFVLLAAASATAAGLPGGRHLLDQAGAVFLDRFWDDAAGGCLDAWDTAWERPDDYRGLNSSMHSVEAMLAVADVTGDNAWRARAARVADLVVRLATEHDGRLPEHFGADWSPDLELNRDRPDDPFKPYGATVGHTLEWARLLLHLEAALGDEAPATLLATAERLFDRAVADGWDVDGAPGFVYTTDWKGTPVVRSRMHWVVAEGIAAAAALHRRTGHLQYAEWYAAWWDHVAEHVRDEARGSWHHELDADNRPTASVWPGKPDLYHAVQATLLPRLPLRPALAVAVRDGAWA
jgi:mannose/cellobiose epimerase-like protein (N-acyl-D-glucosamine 2-epimerase family)